ncbi:hypothetical protein L861_22635 [Litchfieldella anticariensis FP35 = DSM 16096]|uniref:ribose-phosphate diphosphokinase n=1 Tax=Litchfieldella anticariensis (strain DSM 16096 / CECT 5854 / CIP 108499 / LMG 22089 / FP35) TaxID=1121939 RepID=S2KMG1_LITA3|nr:ribose-phosphate diphosphokinase [Halomonas anticariensis]EPC03110.1 hypothetical protein L861_22635 [Halomonas anticariensis FP35 = DSM 16096]
MTSPHSVEAAPAVFLLDDDSEFFEALIQHLGTDLAPFELRDFEDGEHKLRPKISVRGRDVYIVYRLVGGQELSANDRLVRLLFFVATLRDLGAACVTAVVPYLPYARKDRRTKFRDPLNQRYLAQLFEAVGVDRLVTMDVHNQAALENAFRCEVIHLEGRRLMAEAVMEERDGLPLAVMSPDTGGVKRAERFREMLQQMSDDDVNMAFLEKRRSEGVVSGDAVIGELEDRLVVIMDDLIAGGTTMLRAVEACRHAGAKRVIACATHGLFASGAEVLFERSGPDRLLYTNSVPRPLPEKANERARLLRIEPQLARTILALNGQRVEEPDPPLGLV